MPKETNRGFDAGQEHLGHVYAQALLGAAEKQGATDQVMDQLDSLVTDVLDKLPKLRETLSAPKVPVDDKERILEKAFAGRISSVLMHGLKVMARHGRLDCLTAVRNAYRRLYNELRGRVEVQVRVAAPPAAGMLEQIAAQLRKMLNKEVDLKVHVQPEILGGLIVRIGDTLLDGSVKTKLEQMRKIALANTVRELRQTLDRFVAA